MAEADSKIKPARKWVKLVEYVQQKTVEVEDPDIAHRLIVQELERESEARLPLRYKRVDDDGHWHEEGLPVGYYWRDADINWPVSSASWSERIAAGSHLLPKLQIYQIEVAVPIETVAEPAPAAPVPADKPPEAHQAAMLVTDAAGELIETAADGARAESVAPVEQTDAPVSIETAMPAPPKRKRRKHSDTKEERITNILKALIQEDRLFPGLKPSEVFKMLKSRYESRYKREVTSPSGERTITGDLTASSGKRIIARVLPTLFDATPTTPTK